MLLLGRIKSLYPASCPARRARSIDKLTAMLTPKPPTDGCRRSRRRLSPLRRLPPEVLRKIVAYAFHAGYY